RTIPRKPFYLRPMKLRWPSNFVIKCWSWKRKKALLDHRANLFPNGVLKPFFLLIPLGSMHRPGDSRLSNRRKKWFYHYLCGKAIFILGGPQYSELRSETLNDNVQ